MDELITIRGAIGVILLLSLVLAAVASAVMERLKRKLAAAVAAAAVFTLWVFLAALAVTFPDASDEFLVFAVLVSAMGSVMACAIIATYVYERQAEAESKKRNSTRLGHPASPTVSHKRRSR